MRSVQRPPRVRRCSTQPSRWASHRRARRLLAASPCSVAGGSGGRAACGV